MDKYAEAREVINKMADVKMTMNAHKGNIEDLHPSEILALLRGEVNELDQAASTDSETELMHVIEEAADCQNFLLALVHQQIELYRGRK